MLEEEVDCNYHMLEFVLDNCWVDADDLDIDCLDDIRLDFQGSNVNSMKDHAEQVDFHKQQVDFHKQEVVADSYLEKSSIVKL